MDRLHVRHDWTRGERVVDQIDERFLHLEFRGTWKRFKCSEHAPVVVSCLVQRRDIATGNSVGRLAQQPGPVRSGLVTTEFVIKRQESRERPFTFANQEGVDEIGHWLRIGCVAATGNDDRVFGTTVLRPHRNMCQAEHVEDVGVVQFVGEAETEHVELPECVTCFESEQRHTGPAEFGLHVEPGSKDAFGNEPVVAIHHLVQDLHSEV